MFALGTSILSWDNARATDFSPRFHWPDETANAFFASRVARGESLAVPELRNRDTGNLIHPRSVNVRDDGAIVPGSFLGLPLAYGMIGRVFGERAMLFVTPVLAALGLLAFATIVRVLAGARIALLATVLLALHPSVWMFTATALLPNVPFVALLLCGLCCILRASSRPEQSSPRGTQTTLRSERRDGRSDVARGDREALTESERRGEISMRSARGSIEIPRLRPDVVGTLLWMTRGGVPWWFIGGLLLGLALTIRTNELFWVLAIAGAAVRQQKKTSGFFFWKNIGVLACGIAIPFVPILISNHQLYGSPLTTGYALLQGSDVVPTEFASSAIPSWFTAIIAPFGWDPIAALTRFWQYVIAPYWWFVGLAALGIVIGWRPRRALARGTIALTVWLILYYGSWELADPLVRTTNVFTISYVRYWLPITIALAPWAAVGFVWIVDRMPHRARMPTAAFLMLAIASTALMRTATDPIEGLLRQRQAIEEHRVRARAVIAATEPNAVIVSHRMDKVFFPERSVVHAADPPDADPTFASRLRALADTTPTYWYAARVPTVSDLTFTKIGTMPFGEELYRIRSDRNNEIGGAVPAD